jgi:class 3 adenylate cyclase/tetratricopeptide (TPR) repeat protein
MDFYAIVDQVVQLLQQRGRLTYRSLKVHFKLDDETLEALQEEILYSQSHVVDDEGQGLRWTGKAETRPELGSPSQPGQPPSQAASPRRGAPHASDARVPDAERRQLTVLFCDLVDSTALSGQLDPEDLRKLLRAYQAACTEVIERFEGHVAQLLGDGLLVYFGYPQAHEDDAQRAVRAGLGMLEAMGTLNARLERELDVRLAIRVGIHTGLVVVGEMGGAGRHEQLALGETPNVAARVQGIAEPDTVVMSEATAQLVHGYFHCEELGAHKLRGVAQSLNVYRVLQESGAQSRLDITTPRGLTPLVGRESEVTLLMDRWQQAQGGQGQAVLLSGEAGIGKSRLVQVLKEHAAGMTHIRLECRSSPYYQHTALYPIIDLLHRTMHWEPEDDIEVRVRKLEATLGRYTPDVAETVPLFAALLSFPLPTARYAPLTLPPLQQRQQTLDMLVAMFLEEAARQPVLFIVEDLHWTDPTTLELLDLLMAQSPTAALLMLWTCRPEFEPVWSYRSHLAEVSLSRLSKRQMAWMVERVTHGKRFPEEVMRGLIEKTDGVPLYLEEMTKAVIESDVLTEHNDHYELTGSVASIAIPATLHDSLMARLDRLASAKGVAQLGAVIGRQFSYALLQAITPCDADTLQRELARLTKAELIYQRGQPPHATYLFKHALVQDAAYQSLLKSTRQAVHQDIAQVLERQFPETKDTRPELLAHHWTEAGRAAQAVGYWQQAGQRAGSAAAYEDAIIHYTHAQDQLARLPETQERAEQKLNLLLAQFTPLMAARGYAAPEVEEAFLQARELCELLGHASQLPSVLRTGVIVYLNGGRLDTAHELAEALLSLAYEGTDTARHLDAHRIYGLVQYHLGWFAQAREHYEHVLTLFDPVLYRSPLDLQDGQVTALAYSALALWFLGYPDQARQRMHEALTVAQELGHLNTLALLSLYAGWLYMYGFREVPKAQAHAEAGITLSEEHRLVQSLPTNRVALGWAMAMQGQEEDGVAQIQGAACLSGLRRQFTINLSHFISRTLSSDGSDGDRIGCVG